MAGQEEQGQGQRSLEDIRKDKRNLAQSRQKLTDNLAALDAEESALVDEEERLQIEALRAGRPAKPSKKRRDIGLQREQWQAQLTLCEKLKAELEIEECDASLGEAAKSRERNIKEREAAEAALKAAQDVANQAHNKNVAAVELERELKRRRLAASNKLTALSPEAARKSQAEYEQRLQALTEATKKDHERYERERMQEAGFYSTRNQAEMDALQKAAAERGSVLQTAPGQSFPEE
jgi:hypothetical protein